MSQQMEEAPKDKKKLAAMLAAAYAAGFGTGGSGVTGPLIVEGEAPTDAPGWKCESVGPVLDAQRICRLVENVPVFAEEADAGTPDGGN